MLELHSIQFPRLTVSPGELYIDISRITIRGCPSSHFRLLFPLTFLLFNLLYWTNYAGKLGMFDWADHKITGNLE